MGKKSVDVLGVRVDYLDIKDILEKLDEEEEVTQVPYNKCPEIKIKLNNVEVKALIDSGSQLNGISESWFNENKEKLGQLEILNLSNTHIIGALGMKSKLIRKQLLLEVQINDYKFDLVFFVIPSLNKDCILGINMLKEGECNIDFLKHTMTIQNPQYKLKGTGGENIIQLNHMELKENEENCNFQEAVANITIDSETKLKLLQILNKNKALFREEPGRITDYEHVLQITDHTPFFQKGWPVPIAYQEKVDIEIQKMLKFGVIEKSNSQYISPMVTIIKKDQSVRLCLDARRINNVMVPDFEGAQPINELIANCGGVKFMSSIDLRSSFWQVPLKKECRDFTGFMYKGKTYRFTVTPFGLKTSLASLTRGLDTVLSDEVKKFTIIYVDDCLCLSNSIQEHLQHLELLLSNLDAANLTVNFQKSQFFRKEIDYLGFRLSVNEISPMPDKVLAIQNFPRPLNQKQLNGFLGLTNFYNRFTSKYAETTHTLLQLLKKDRNFKWTEQLDQQFNLVKKLFSDTVVLQHPDTSKPYYLQTDASNYALGGQLYQLDEEGQIAVVAFTSRTFKGAELNYHTTEKELLSIIHCLRKFRIYLLGNRFTIITDNKALTFLHKCHLSNARITRWILSIQEYDFNIIHCKGRENIVADILSRHPEHIKDCGEVIFNAEMEINKITVKMDKKIIHLIKNIDKVQKQDQKLTNIINAIENKEDLKLIEKYQYVNNVLYRQDKQAWKVYVPNNVRDEIIKELHTTYGHCGTQKTELFKEYFTGEQINKTVHHVISRCDLCQRCKDHHKGNVGETHAIITKQKGELVSIDYYGPLITSKGGVKYILVIVDNFTKYVKLYSLRCATTHATINKVKQYVELCGKPIAILTDNGTQFTAARWTTSLHEMGIKPKFTAIRNPCVNLAERVNRQLGNLFRVFIRKKHSNWATYLSAIEICLNETHHSTIEVSPFEAQFGKKPTREWTKFFNFSILQDTPICKPEEIYMRIKEKRERNAEKLNQRNLTKFEIGDLVLLKTCPISVAINKIISKFCDLYEGPYRIKKQISNATYLLEYLDSSKGSRGNFNVRQLKKYIT